MSHARKCTLRKNCTGIEGTIDLQRFEPSPSQFVSAHLYCSLFSEDGLDGGVVLRARHSPRRAPSRRCNIIQLVVCTFLPLSSASSCPTPTTYNGRDEARRWGGSPFTHSLSDSRSFSQSRMTSPFEMFPSRKLLCPQYFSNRPQN